MRCWCFIYIVVPVLIGVLIGEYNIALLRLFKTFINFDDNPDPYDLVIFVPSARNNFELRSTIRETWLGHVQRNTTKNSRVLVKFTIGRQACHLPPDDRVDVHSCEEWNVDKEHSDGENLTAVDLDSSNVEASSYRVHGIQSMSFIVLHPVVLTKLGIYKDSIGLRARVKLLERITQREIVSALFTKESRGTKIGSFRYRTVQPYFLPKGFQGIVVGENLDSGNGILPFDLWSTTLRTSRNNGSGVLQFLEEDVIPEGHYHSLRRWKSRPIDIVSFIFNIQEVEPLRQHVAQKPVRLAAWALNSSVESHRLDDEAKQFKDILFVDVVDVYRNVPKKILHFTQWAVENIKFKFLLKTDDDCFVDVERVLSRIESLGNIHKAWLGRFRHNWAVERHGKWAELSYPAMIYPSFACGSGYLLTSDLVKWIANNAHTLKSYQGEDVSMGIWLAAVAPTYIDEPLWQCEKDCLSDMYTEPDLRTDEIQQAWSDLQTCGDPCGCS